MPEPAASLELDTWGAYYSCIPCGAALRHDSPQCEDIDQNVGSFPISRDSNMIRPTDSRTSRSGHLATRPSPRLADDDRKRRGGEPGAPGGPGSAVITKTKPQVKRPSMYRVLLLNDDYTPMEFVVLVLEKFFNKDREAATRIMLHVHHHGIGECGIFTYEIAETKVTQVMDFARKHQHPLQCVMEKK